MPENPGKVDTSPRERDRKTTSARLLDAVGAFIAREGFGKLGVNAIAREAGVDKVLVYRYFGGMEGLLRAYAEQGDFWWTVDEIVGDGLPYGRPNTISVWMGTAMKRHMEALLRRPVTLEIMAWETIDRNELTVELERIRTTRSAELRERLLQQFAGRLNDTNVDIDALAVLLGAASNYLVLRSRKIEVFDGVTINTEEGRDRLASAVETLIALALGD